MSKHPAATAREAPSDASVCDATRRALQQMPGYVFAVECRGDSSARWLYLSPSLATLLSMNPLESSADAQPFLGRVHPDDLARLTVLLARVTVLPAEFREQIRLDAHTQVRCFDVSLRVERAGEVLVTYGYGFEVPAPALLGSPWAWRVWISIFEQSSEGIMVCDIDSRILFVNPAFEFLTGYTFDEAVGKTPRLLHSGRQGQAFYARMWRVLLTDGHWHGEVVNRRKSGEFYTEWLSIRAVHALGRLSHYVGVFTDITERKRAEERMDQLTNFDPLTELPNRVLLALRMEQMLDDAARSGGNVALLCLDLDSFKTVNDSIGHAGGDQLLKAMAARLSNCVRRTDLVARFGGDEFAIVLPGIGTRTEAGAAAQKVLKEIGRPLTVCGQELSISASIGVCLYPDDAVSAGDMLRHADSAMYQAKGGGHSRFEFHSPQSSERARTVLSTANALRHAIERNELELYYQPQVELASGLVVGAEALIRWHRPDHGLVAPDQFIPIAEERGLIGAVGEWVLHEAVSQVAAWHVANLPPLRVAINLSATQFHEPAIAARVLHLLRASGTEPQRLCLEITEGTIMKDTSATIEILRQLHESGVQLSIDDFGTGYSSLSYLRHFPINEIKIDKSFVREMLDDRGAAGIVAGVIALARNLQLRVIAEGVETVAELALLRSMQCGLVQGYLISKPKPVAEFEEVLHAWPERSAELLGAPTDPAHLRGDVS